MSDDVRINGTAHSWGSVKFTMNGEVYTGISSVTYSDKLEVAKAYGMGKAQKPRARSRGKYVPEQLVIKAYTETAEDIREQLEGPSGSYGMTEIQVVLQYLEGARVYTVEFEDCRLVEDGSSDEEGSEVLSVELKFDVMAIRRNGRTLFEDSRS